VNDSVHAGIAVFATLFIVAVLTARWWATPLPEPTPYDDDHDTVVTPLADLMGEWDRNWEPVYGDALAQARGERS
jgi:hypothetical protein